MQRFIIIFIALSFIFIFAQESDEAEIKPELGLFGVAGKIGGLYLIDGYGITPGFGLWGDIGTIAPNIPIDAGLEYWNGGKPDKGKTVHMRNIAVYLTIKVKIEINKWAPFLGGGLGVNMYSKIYPEEWNQPDEKNTNLELHIDMGVRYPIHRKIDIEGRFKANFSDVSAYGIYTSAIFKLEEKSQE